MKLLKKLFIFCIICAVVAVLAFSGINIYVRSYAAKFILTQEQASALENVDCITVLGAKVREDGSPSLMLESRISKALELYKSGVSNKILMSGDHGRTEYDEVNNMMNYALENSDISREEVFLDHAGFSTYETAYRAKAVFQVQKSVFVTQKYHLYRTVYNARKNGIEAYGVACDDYDWPGMGYNKFRESLAIFKDFWYCLFDKNPTYLGEAIPVSGSGTASHDITE